MSELETRVGKLKCTGKTEAEFTGSHTKDIFDFVEENELYLTPIYYSHKFVKLPDGLIWEVISDSRLHEDEVFNAVKLPDGTIEYQLHYYNGGCSYGEALDYATKEIL